MTNTRQRLEIPFIEFFIIFPFVCSTSDLFLLQRHCNIRPYEKLDLGFPNILTCPWYFGTEFMIAECLFYLKLLSVSAMM